ncbi:MAG: NlpC/P60 family protein, partial [Bdellovibrionota bacterium]
MKLMGLALIAILISGCATGTRHSRLPDTLPLSPPFRSDDSGTCSALESSDRLFILQVADPVNYPSTRYRKGPNLRLSTKVETDCSHFVHEVYKQAGLPYAFRPTEGLVGAPEFEKVPDSEARAGDLLVMHGHVGILDEEGRLISATLTRHRRAPSSITRYDLSNFRKIRGKRTVL